MISRLLTTLLMASLLAISAPPAHADYQLETVAEGLNFPWSIAFLPDGDYLVATRPGELLRISEAGEVSEPFTGVPDTLVAGQGGYFDIMLDNNFATNQTVYLSFAWGTLDANATRIVKGRLSDAGLEDTEVLFTVSPTKAGGAHYGGKMIQLSDDTIVLSTGDGFEYREAAQDKFSQLGKIIRLNKDGSAPVDNPFANGEAGNPFVWSYGHRNTQGLVVEKSTNTIYNHEHGPQGGDEINLVEKAKNYGWPAITYGINYSGAYVSPFQKARGMEQPLKYWVPSIAPSGFALYQGDAFPAWRGDFFVGALVDKEVRRVDMENGKVVAEEPLFSELDARIRDVRVGPDGFLYLLTDSISGALIRVKP
ncbi:MAG: glucose/arabinose dehydrogenase [Flavobacterium sp.]|jgi:glucose/arabinose dehydrogenase